MLIRFKKSITGLNSLKNKLKCQFADKRFSEILNGTVWAMGARIVATCMGIVTSIIIARAYGAEVMGILAVLNSFFALATIFTVLGTNTSILSLIPEHLTKYSPTSAFKVYRKTQYLVAGISVITGGLLFFASGFISATIFSKPYFRYYFVLAAFFIVFKSLMILNTQAVRGLRLIKVFAFMQLLPTFSKLIILVVITLFFYNRDNPIYAFLSSIAVTSLIGIVVMKTAFKRQIRPDDISHEISIKNILSAPAAGPRPGPRPAAA
jgi:O-antigen/teichoic acid export membrane protein